MLLAFVIAPIAAPATSARAVSCGGRSGGGCVSAAIGIATIGVAEVSELLGLWERRGMVLARA